MSVPVLAPPGPVPAASELLALAEVGAEEDLAWGEAIVWA